VFATSRRGGLFVLGIIGGVGPRATARLYLELTERVSSTRRDLPPLLIHSIEMSASIENAYLAGRAEGTPAQAMVRRLLEDAVERLQAAGARRIAMPCNTLQDELEAICRRSGIAHLHMVDATVRAVVDAGLRRVLLLATSTTCATGLYRRRLEARGIRCIHPAPADQAVVDTVIRGALDLRTNETSFAELVSSWAADCDGIIIGCTDLCGEASALRAESVVFDALECLTDMASRTLADETLGAR